MPTELLSFVAFTLVPLAALLVGIGLSVGASYLLRDRRILLAGLLFALMASHQTTEVVAWLAGTVPYQNYLAESFETAVNLLAVVAIVYIVSSLTEERLLTESLADVQHQLIEGRPGRSTREEGDAAVSPGNGAGGLRDRLSNLFGLENVTGVVALGQHGRLDRVLGRAIEDARVTYPIATFDAQLDTPVEVVADEPYLQEVFEIVLEQLVLYNDTSNPIVEAEVREGEGTVAVRFTHNGSGVPEEVRAILESGAGSSHTELAELVFVETFVSKWGGSVAIDAEDTGITITFLTPRFSGFFD